MTYGERAVGLSFNPSGDARVAQIKRLYAEVIDLLDAYRAAAGPEAKRLYEVAITEAQGAQMWAVKSITWKEDQE
jgi:hypothetical protein